MSNAKRSVFLCGSVDRYGDPTGYSETLAGIALKVRDEAFAPTGRE